MKLSIITINLNNKEGLKKTIESVLCQTFKNYQYLIIDGASNDGSVDIIRKYSLENSLDWTSEPDNGIFQAMNKGIIKSKGEYLFFLNSGDTLIHSDVLLNVLNYNYQKDYDYIFGNFNITKNCKVLYENVTLKFNEPTLYDLMTDALPHQASLIKKSLFERNGLYDENLKFTGDWEFCLRAIIVKNCSIVHIPITISNYDIDGIISKNDELFLNEKENVLNSLFPPKIISDYRKIVPIKKDLEKLIWFQERKLFHTLFVILYLIGKKLYKINKNPS